MKRFADVKPRTTTHNMVKKSMGTFEQSSVKDYVTAPVEAPVEAPAEASVAEEPAAQEEAC